MTVSVGRIGRLGFFVGYCLLVSLAVGIVNLPLAPTVMALVFLPLFFPAMLLVVLRAHDLGRTPFATFWRDQIPLIGPALGLWELFFRSGSPEANVFGPVPRL